MFVNIFCKFEKARYNIFCVRAVIANNKGGVWPQSKVLGTILSHFSRPKVTLKTIAKVNKLDAGTPSCTQPPSHFQ